MLLRRARIHRHSSRLAHQRIPSRARMLNQEPIRLRNSRMVHRAHIHHNMVCRHSSRMVRQRMPRLAL